MFNAKNKQIVDLFINDPGFQRMVEADLGKPIRVKVLWDKGVVQFFGSIRGKVLKIKDILDGYREGGVHMTKDVRAAAIAHVMKSWEVDKETACEEYWMEIDDFIAGAAFGLEQGFQRALGGLRSDEAAGKDRYSFEHTTPGMWADWLEKRKKEGSE